MLPECVLHFVINLLFVSRFLILTERQVADLDLRLVQNRGAVTCIHCARILSARFVRPALLRVSLLRHGSLRWQRVRLLQLGEPLQELLVFFGCLLRKPVTNPDDGTSRLVNKPISPWSLRHSHSALGTLLAL